MKAHLFYLLGLAAASTQAADLSACQTIADNTSRLACYDNLAQQAAPATTAAPAVNTAGVVATPTQTPEPVPAQESKTYAAQTFSQRWELDKADKSGIFNIKPYQPVYLMPIAWRQNINNSPCSPNPKNCSHRPDQGYKNLEATFQLSLKTKMLEDAFGSNIDLWAGYTQQSYWQVYDDINSSPFRETDFQPEMWATLPVDMGPEWLKLRMVNLGLVHQSNGQTDPLSRSWNRVYASFGLTSGDLSVIVKPWWKIPENSADDNNPDMSDYAGRMETLLIYPWNKQLFTLTWRNNLAFNHDTPNRSFLQLDWAFPLAGKLNGYVQLFNGWGSSLQNYNFYNSGAAIGVSLVNWQ